MCVFVREWLEGLVWFCLESFLFRMYLGSFTLPGLHKAKRVQLNGKTLQVLKTSLAGTQKWRQNHKNAKICRSYSKYWRIQTCGLPKSCRGFWSATIINFKTPQVWRSWISSHRKWISMLSCSKTFQGKNCKGNSVAHFKKFHADRPLESEVQCPRCPKDMAKSSLNSHMEQKHQLKNFNQLLKSSFLVPNAQGPIQEPK